MNTKILTPDEIPALEECLLALADYHNTVADNKDFTYPTAPVSDTIRDMIEQIKAGESIVSAVYEEGVVAGFCMIHISRNEHSSRGEIKYLFVKECFRGHGYGSMLMDWATAELDRLGVDSLELRVVTGNPAVRFYEKYGFRPRILVMSKKND